MRLSHKSTYIILAAVAFVVSGCTVSEKYSRHYRGYIRVPVYAKVPIWLHINENHQLGPGKGYVLDYSHWYHGDKIGILPVGHPVTFTKAYQSYSIGGGATWMEGSTWFNGKDYYVQLPLAYGAPQTAEKELHAAFSPIKQK